MFSSYPSFACVSVALSSDPWLLDELSDKFFSTRSGNEENQTSSLQAGWTTAVPASGSGPAVVDLMVFKYWMIWVQN